MNGIASSAKAESLGLVTTIMMMAPIISTRLRSAVAAVVENAALIWVVSAVSRDTTSPVRCTS